MSLTCVCICVCMRACVLAINEMLDYPIDESLLSEHETLGKMKVVRFVGRMVYCLKCCCANLLDHLVGVCVCVAQGGCMWKDALIVPILKKGDLSLYDNCMERH